MGSLQGHWGVTGVSLGYHWGITVVSLGYHWGVTGHSRLREKAPEKNPQNDAFLHPACKAKVSSRLDGSTVSTVSPGPLLGTILASIWATFGYHLGKMSHKWHTSVTQVSHKCHTSVTQVSHKCHTSVAEVSHKCHTSVTQLSLMKTGFQMSVVVLFW